MACDVSPVAMFRSGPAVSTFFPPYIMPKRTNNRIKKIAIPSLLGSEKPLTRMRGLMWPVLRAWCHCWWCKLQLQRAKDLARGSEAPTTALRLAVAGDAAGFGRRLPRSRSKAAASELLRGGGRLAARRHEPHLPANPIKLRTETPTAASGLPPPSKKPASESKNF